jgi:serine/threonine protein kinase
MRDGPRRLTSKTDSPPPADPLVGRVIAGKFAVNERLGAGAMGIVYRATQIALERTVAIKVLHREFAADSEFADRFWREAKAASRLDHPNSIRVFDFGQEPDGLLYLAMEYVEGTDLFDWLSQRAPIGPLVIIELLSQVLAALAVAHDMAVVHRDLKPENIMIVRGTSDDGSAIDIVKVCDFGIAKLLDASAPPSSPANEPRRKHSTTGLIVGTPAYMSPEQARGEAQDARSDLYAVGIMLYELLTGRLPFEAETLIGVALKHVSDQPERPSARAAGVDPELEAICLKAISKKPADRYQNAREMRVALQGVASKFAPGSEHSFVFSPVTVAALPGPHRRHDSSKPTLVGVTPGTPVPRAKRSRAWLALLLLPVLAGAWFVRTQFSPLNEGEGARAVSTVPPTPLHAASALAEPEPLSTGAAIGSTVGVARHDPGAKTHHGKGEISTRVAGGQALSARDSDSVEAAPTASPVVTLEPSISTNSRGLADLPAVARVAPAATSTPVAPAGPSYDLTLARVSIGSARNVVGATAASVTRAVAEAAARITACYKSALPQLGGVFEGSDVLHVETDGAGVITDARLSGPVRGSAAACVASAVQGHRVANVDTGNASADVPLSFRDH